MVGEGSCTLKVVGGRTLLAREGPSPLIDWNQLTQADLLPTCRMGACVVLLVTGGGGWRMRPRLKQ